MGMGEELLLRAHEASPQNFIGKLHFMGRFVVDLLAEKIGHGGRIFVQVDAFRPAAVDVVHEPLEGPKTTEKVKALIVRDPALARGLPYSVHGRGRGVLLALAAELLRQRDSRICDWRSHLKLPISLSSN